MSIDNKPPRTVSVQDQRGFVLLADRLGGCTCSPDLTFREISPGVNIVDVAHDGDCGHLSQQKGRDA